MKERWPDGCIWRLHPDEHTAINWKEIKNYLKHKETEIDFKRNLQTDRDFNIIIRKKFNIVSIAPVNSYEEPLIQLSDLFSGMAVFSRTKFDNYLNWDSKKSGQLGLYDNSPEYQHSQADIVRFEVLDDFNEKCKKHNLYVSLRKKNGLYCFKPDKPFNFWLYEPQHPADKAPVKQGNKNLRR